MRVPASGVSGAEDKEKDQGVVARRGLKVVRSKDAGRWTRTGYEVWYAWGERARDREALLPPQGVLYKSGVYASKVICLTLGDLRRVRSGLSRE